MKQLLIITLTLGLLSIATAEEVGLNVDKINAQEDTTISISKGNKKSNTKKYTISEGENQITSDKEVVKKEAQQSWKMACSDWKKEFRDLNKDNKIISMSCGTMNCTKDGVESTCSSVAKYKVRIVVEE